MGAISLTVNSVGNKNMTAYSGTFVVEKMTDIRDNANKTTAMTISEAGDINGVLTNNTWRLYGQFTEGQVLYWSVETVTGITRRIRIYTNSSRTRMIAEGTAVIADGNSGTVFLAAYRDSGVTGSVTLTIGGGGLTDDTDAGNTLTLTNVTVQQNLQLNGEAQFMYNDGKERWTKVTVADTVAEIQAKIAALTS